MIEFLTILFIVIGVAAFVFPLILCIVYVPESNKSTTIIIYLLIGSILMLGYIDKASRIIAREQAIMDQKAEEQYQFEKSAAPTVNPARIGKDVEETIKLVKELFSRFKDSKEVSKELETIAKNLESKKPLDTKEITFLRNKAIEKGLVVRPSYVRQTLKFPDTVGDETRQLFGDVVRRGGKTTLIDSAAEAYRRGDLEVINGVVEPDAFGGFTIRKIPGKRGDLIINDKSTGVSYGVGAKTVQKSEISSGPSTPTATSEGQVSDVQEFDPVKTQKKKVGQPAKSEQKPVTPEPTPSAGAAPAKEAPPAKKTTPAAESTSAEDEHSAVYNILKDDFKNDLNGARDENNIDAVINLYNNSIRTKALNPDEIEPFNAYMQEAKALKLQELKNSVKKPEPFQDEILSTAPEFTSERGSNSTTLKEDLGKQLLENQKKNVDRNEQSLSDQQSYWDRAKAKFNRLFSKNQDASKNIQQTPKTPEEFVEAINKIDSSNPEKAIDELYALRRQFGDDANGYSAINDPLSYYRRTNKLTPVMDALKAKEKELGVDYYAGKYTSGDGKHYVPNNEQSSKAKDILVRIENIKGSPEEIATQLSALKKEVIDMYGHPDHPYLSSALWDKVKDLGFEYDTNAVGFKPRNTDPSVAVFNRAMNDEVQPISVENNPFLSTTAESSKAGYLSNKNRREAPSNVLDNTGGSQSTLDVPNFYDTARKINAAAREGNVDEVERLLSWTEGAGFRPKQLELLKEEANILPKPIIASKPVEIPLKGTLQFNPDTGEIKFPPKPKTTFESLLGLLRKDRNAHTKRENIAKQEPPLDTNKVEPINTAAPEIVAPTADPELAGERLGSVVENGNPVATAKQNRVVDLWNKGIGAVKSRVSKGIESIKNQVTATIENQKRIHDKEKADWSNTLTRADEINKAQEAIETQSKVVNDLKSKVEQLDPNTEEFYSVFDELQTARSELSKRIHDFSSTYNRGVNDNISNLAKPQEVNFDAIEPGKFTVDNNLDHIIKLNTPMSKEQARFLEGNNPGVKINSIDPSTGSIELVFDTRIRPGLEANRTADPFTRANNQVPPGDINQPLIEKQLDLIRALERKYAAQLMTGQSTAGTEAALTDARTTLQKLEGVTSKSLEDMTKQLASYIPGNLKLNKDTGRFEYIPGYDQAKDLLDRLPTPEARKLLEDRGYKIITPEEGYHSGYTTYVSTPDGVMPVTVPGRRPDNVVIVPKDYVSSDGYVIPGNNFNDIVYRPGKGTISLKTKDPVTDVVRQNNASNNTSGISLDGNTFTINRQNELFKPLSRSGLGHNSFGTNVSRAYHAGGKHDPASGRQGMGIAPKLLFGTAGTVGTTWAGKELSENYISPWAESATTGWYNLWQDNPRKPILQINGNEIVNPTGLGSTTTLNADGTATRKGKDEDGNTTVDTYQKINGVPVESTVYDKEDKPVKTEVFDSGGELKERVTRGPDDSETVEKRGPDKKFTRKVVPPPKDPTLGDWMTKNVVPEYFSNKENFGSYGHSLFGALAGGAIGAGIGGLNYILTDENELSEEEKKKRSLARAMLSSAGIGAGIGGLVGGASDYTRKV